MKPRTVGVKPVRANIGIEMQLYRALREITDQMVAEVERKLNPPVNSLANDASFAEIMNILADLRNRWRSIWDARARPLAARALKEAYAQGDAAYQRALRQHGISVKFTKTPEIEAALGTQLQKSVAMITAVPEYLFEHIERQATKAVETGGVKEFQTWLKSEIPGVGRRRARIIANHQVSAANAQVTATRTAGLGLMCEWRHSRGAFKTRPRPTHVKLDKTLFDPSVGAFDSDPAVSAYIQPGSLINCKCVAIPRLPTTLAR